MRDPLLIALASTTLAAAGWATGALAAPTRPPGSYQASCRNVQVAGGMLSADCKDMRGAFRSSSIAYQHCRGELGNNNGVLTCNGATATVAPVQDRGETRWSGDTGFGPRQPNAGWNRGADGRSDYGDQGSGGRGYGPPPSGQDASRGVYPEFAPLEDHIRDSIRDGLRNDLIERDDAHDLFRQLNDIQARERWEFQAHGWNLPQEDRWRIRHDLKQLDSQVDQIRQQP